MNKKGFTLVELLAVIVIVGILATVGVIAVTNIISNSENKALVEEGLNLAAAGRYAYENNDNLAGSNKVCISLETLNETGYYEKGKSEDYAGSVLITNNDGKITTTFWINKENSKYIEGASLTATEDNVIKETKLKYENKESLNNGSFCNFKTDAEKNSVNVGTKDNLDEYDGDKITINLYVDKQNINNDITGLDCNNKKEECPEVEPSDEPGDSPMDFNNIPNTGDSANNYLVFANDPDHNLFRSLGTSEIDYCNSGDCTNDSNYKKEKLPKIVQANFASFKQIKYKNNVDSTICYDGNWSKDCLFNGDTEDETTKYQILNYQYHDRNDTNQPIIIFVPPLNRDNSTNTTDTYLEYLESVNIKATNEYIPTINWTQKAYYMNLDYHSAGSEYNKVSNNIRFKAQISILSEDDFTNRKWLQKNAIEVIMDLARCLSYPSGTDNVYSCYGSKYVINGNIRPSTHTQTNGNYDSGTARGYIRPTFFLTPDKNKIYPPKGVSSNLIGTKEHPYIIVQV